MRKPGLAATAAFLAFATMTLTLAADQKSAPQEQKSSIGPAYSPAEIASGKKVYGKQCEICHFSGSKAKKIGPGLAGIYARGKFADGKKVDDASMRGWIGIGGKNMPGFKTALKADEIRDLIAYLHSI